MSKIGLVLEGGGMRGAYTAGALAWLIDNNIEFKYGTGISSGAMHICSYFKKDKKALEDIGCRYMSDKRNVGIIPLLKEGRYVGYDYMFDDLLVNTLKYDTTEINNNKDYEVEIGLFDCEEGKTVFFGNEECNLRFLKAACTLPIAGRIVDYKNHKYLDGGIEIMIPIDRSIDKGNDKHLVITTKPEGYVRKNAGLFMRWFMKLNYLKYPGVYKQYFIRAKHYNEQMDKIYDLVEKKKAILVRPSQNIPVKRFSGDYDNLVKLYQLGYNDMESRKDEILTFIGE